MAEDIPTGDMKLDTSPDKDCDSKYVYESLPVASETTTSSNSLTLNDAETRKEIDKTFQKEKHINDFIKSLQDPQYESTDDNKCDESLSKFVVHVPPVESCENEESEEKTKRNYKTSNESPEVEEKCEKEESKTEMMETIRQTSNKISESCTHFPTEKCENEESEKEVYYQASKGSLESSIQSTLEKSDEIESKTEMIDSNDLTSIGPSEANIQSPVENFEEKDSSRVNYQTLNESCKGSVESGIQSPAENYKVEKGQIETCHHNSNESSVSNAQSLVVKCEEEDSKTETIQSKNLTLNEITESSIQSPEDDFEVEKSKTKMIQGYPRTLNGTSEGSIQSPVENVENEERTNDQIGVNYQTVNEPSLKSTIQSPVENCKKKESEKEQMKTFEQISNESSKQSIIIKTFQEKDRNGNKELIAKIESTRTCSTSNDSSMKMSSRLDSIFEFGSEEKKATAPQRISRRIRGQNKLQTTSRCSEANTCRKSVVAKCEKEESKNVKMDNNHGTSIRTSGFTCAARCNLHNHPIEYWCVNCDAAKCDRCISLVYNKTCVTHDVKIISIYAQEKKVKKFEELQKISSACLTDLDRNIKELHTINLQSELQTLVQRDRIHQEFVSFHEMLIEEERKILERLQITVKEYTDQNNLAQQRCSSLIAEEATLMSASLDINKIADSMNVLNKLKDLDLRWSHLKDRVCDASKPIKLVPSLLNKKFTLHTEKMNTWEKLIAVSDPVELYPNNFTVFLEGKSIEAPIQVCDLFTCKNSTQSFDLIDVHIEIKCSRQVIFEAVMRMHDYVFNMPAKCCLDENQRYVLKATLYISDEKGRPWQANSKSRNIMIVTGEKYSEAQRYMVNIRGESIPKAEFSVPLHDQFDRWNMSEMWKYSSFGNSKGFYDVSPEELRTIAYTTSSAIYFEFISILDKDFRRNCSTRNPELIHYFVGDIGTKKKRRVRRR